MIFIADFIACSTCFGHHYAHHQELESIIQMVAACGIWCFGFQVVGMTWSWGLCVRFAGCCCNKYHLLHLVGILFPHICLKHSSFLEELNEIWQKMYTGIHTMYSLFLLEFNEKIFFDRCLKNTQISEFMKLHPVGVELFHADRHEEAISRLSQFCKRN